MLGINLNTPPAERWAVLSPERMEQARHLLETYLNDLGELPLGGLQAYATVFVKRAYRQEMRSLAQVLSEGLREVLAANLYYDVLKVIFGCTAFAVDTPDGPLHARNLDWWTENDILADYTLVTRFEGEHPFITVGWPGFVGCLSGVAPGRFAVTLNAVLSSDKPFPARPISMFLRTVLANARDYAHAKRMLTRTPIAADCLLLLTGTQPGEMVVIERTPRRSALRHPENGTLTVTNAYHALEQESAPGSASMDLLATASRRYDTACTWLELQRPTTPAECFPILNDVAMPITVQQMVFHAASGSVEVRLPNQSGAT